MSASGSNEKPFTFQQPKPSSHSLTNRLCLPLDCCPIARQSAAGSAALKVLAGCVGPEISPNARFYLMEAFVGSMRLVCWHIC